MPRFALFTDTDRVIRAGGERASLPAGQGVELGDDSREALSDPTILPPPGGTLRPTARIAPGGLEPQIPEEQLDALPEAEPVVAELRADAEVELDGLEPLRDQVHASGRDLIVVLTDSGG